MKINFDYLRPLKAESMKKMYGKLSRREELTSESYADAVILSLQGGGNGVALGGVIDQEGNYVSSSVCHGMEGSAYAYEDVKERREKVVYCGFFRTQWGHFLMDSTRRLWYFLKNDTTIDKYIYITQTDAKVLPEKNEIEFLQLLGIWDKIEIINCPTRFRQVIIPEEAFNKEQDYYSSWHKKVFDYVIQVALERCRKEHIEVKSNRKIFFSRSHFIEAHRISNQMGESGQKLLDNFFEKNGYEIFYPEELCLTEMIEILQQTGECAMVEGTLAHNLMFAKSGTKAVILEKRFGHNGYQVYVNEVKDLDVDYIDAYYVFYPCDIGTGPFYSGFTAQLEAYADARGMELPDADYLSETYQRKGFESYMRTCKSRIEILFEMDELQNPVYWEVYRDSLEKFRDYLIGRKYWNTKGVYMHLYSGKLTKVKILFRTVLSKIKQLLRNNLDLKLYRKLSYYVYKVLGTFHKLFYHDT